MLIQKKLDRNLCKMIENSWKQYNTIVLQSRQKCPVSGTDGQTDRQNEWSYEEAHAEVCNNNYHRTCCHAITYLNNEVRRYFKSFRSVWWWWETKRNRWVWLRCKNKKINKSWNLPLAWGSLSSQVHAILTCQNGGAVPIKLPVIITEG